MLDGHKDRKSGSQWKLTSHFSFYIPTTDFHQQQTYQIRIFISTSTEQLCFKTTH